MTGPGVVEGDGGGEPVPGGRRRSFRALATRVLIVQALTLLALWLLQRAFGA